MSGRAYDFGDIQLQWGFGPGFSHDCMPFKDPQRGPRTAFCRRLIDLSEEIRLGRLDEEAGMRRVLGAVAAFLYQKESGDQVVLTTATAVEEEDEASSLPQD
ncbi:MAG: hypothetical protein VKI63_06010 [Cyanobium sp.]|nr:hypothetical protein [Cyanobium sp.]